MKGIRNLFGRFISLLSARILTTIIAVISTPIIVRLLGPGRYGDYAVLLAVFSLYMIPVSGAVSQGVQKYVAEYRELANWRENVVRFYGLLAVGIGVVAAGGLFALTALGPVEAIFGPAFTLYFFLLAAFVLVAQLRAFTQHAVLGFGLERLSGPLKVVQKTVTVTTGIALVFLYGYGVEGMLAGHIVANVVVAAVAGYIITTRLSVRNLVGGRSGSFPYREVLSFNGFNVVLVLLVMSLYHVDVIMLRVLIGDQTTGFYKAALALAEYIWVVPKVLSVVLLHSSSTLWSDGRDEDVSALASRVSRYTLLLVVLLALGLAALADTFVPLYYGPEFAISTVPLLLLIPGVIGFALARPLKAIGQGSGQIKTLIVAAGVVAGVNLVLNAVMIPLFGMNGAAIATSASYGSMFVLFTWASFRIGFNPLEDIRIGRIALTAALSAVPIFALAEVISSDILALVIVPLVGLVVYSSLALATGAVTAGELRRIFRQLPDPLGSTVEAGLVRLQ